MIDSKLTISDLMEGALALLLSKPIAVGLFILADALIAYGFLWAEGRYELGFLLMIGLGAAGHSLISSFLILALGDRLAELLAHPVELLTRVAFVLAASLLVMVGAGVGLALLIVPGLYLLARWLIVSPLILLQGAGIGEALGRSWKLTERSAWAIVAVSLIIYTPQIFIGFVRPADVALDLTPALGFELVVVSCLVAFEVAVIVFACNRLSSPRHEMGDVFA